eukprot:4330437-Alexandrium_andersonii.AAC.1
MPLALGLLLRRQLPGGLARCRDHRGRQRGEVPREGWLAAPLLHLGLRQRPLPPPRVLRHPPLSQQTLQATGRFTSPVALLASPLAPLRACP